MELTQIESFLRVAELGSITRAAETLCLTQPAVTQQVRALERELGAPLFDRTGRGMALTAAGESFLVAARRSLELLAEGRLLVQSLEAGEGGRLQIGAGVTTCIFRLPPVLRLFRERRPQVEVVVRTGRSQEIAAQVQERRLDLGLVTSDIAHPDLHAERLFEEEIVLVTPAGGAEVERRLEAAPLILYPPGSGFREYLDRVFAEAGIRVRVIMETDSVEAIKGFVEVGLGMSFLPEAAVREEVTAGRLTRAGAPGLPPLRRSTSVLHRRDRHLSGAARGFLEVLREQFPTVTPAV